MYLAPPCSHGASHGQQAHLALGLRNAFTNSKVDTSRFSRAITTTAALQRSHIHPMQLLIYPTLTAACLFHPCSTIPVHLLTIQRPSCRPTLTAVKPSTSVPPSAPSFALRLDYRIRNPCEFRKSATLGANAARLYQTRMPPANVTPRLAEKRTAR